MTERRKVSETEFEAAYANKDNRNIIKSALRGYKNALSPEELAGCGMIALWKALGYYQSSFNQKFTTSLVRFVKWECNRELGKLARIRTFNGNPLYPIHNEMPEALKGARLEDIVNVQECLALLAPEKQTILKEYYYEGLTLREIGKKNGYCKVTARNRLDRAILSLTIALNQTNAGERV